MTFDRSSFIILDEIGPNGIVALLCLLLLLAVSFWAW